MSVYLQYVLIAAVAYCVGSISFGIILSKVFKGPDLHTVGSGSTGASNVLRTMGVKMGLLTLVGDFSKALLVCLISGWITHDPWAVRIAGLACIIGHNWPVFFKFKGGKGVASSCGVMTACFPVAGLISMISAVIIIATTRFISLGSMCMLSLFAILVSFFFSDGNIWIIAWAVLLAGLCIWRHRSNIDRLVHGKERKIGQKEKIN